MLSSRTGLRLESSPPVAQRRKNARRSTLGQMDRSLRGDQGATAKASSQKEAETVEEAETLSPRTVFQTGTMDLTTTGATRSFVQEPLLTEKLVVFIRHGISSWNAEGRIQVS